MFRILLWCLTFIVIDTNAAKIFSIVPYNGKSHFTLIEPLLKRLAERGHEVDVATHFPSKNELPRYNEISLVGSLPFYNNESVQNLRKLSVYKIIEILSEFIGINMCSAVLNMPKIKKTISSPRKYDLVFTEIFGTDCVLGFAHTFNATIVSLIPYVNLPWSGERIGNIDNPSYIPNVFLDSTLDTSFYQRFKNTFLLIYIKLLHHFFQAEKSEEINKTFFGPNVPSVKGLVQKTSLILASRHFSVNYINPNVPNFLEVGGLQINRPNPLSEHYKNILNTSKGVIYVSMGSILSSESFESEKLQGMFDAFSELSYKVLWKADPKNFPKGLHNIPKNIYFEKWMPQFDILCHPNVKMFVTHGGLLGSQEATYCGVPRLGIPIFLDQIHNVLNYEKLGIAETVAYDDINKETILSVSKKLLHDPRHRENAEKFARIFKDRPILPLDEAVYWIEYVIKYKGASHLRNMAADLQWFEYYCIDVAAAISVIVAAVYIAITVLVKRRSTT